MKRSIALFAVCIPLIHALDVPPSVAAALVRFGEKHKLPLEHVSFRQHESYFKEHPDRRMHISLPHIVYVGPSLQKQLVGSGVSNDPEQERFLVRSLKEVLAFNHPLPPRLYSALEAFYGQYHIPQTFSLVGATSRILGSHTLAAAQVKHATILLADDFQRYLLQGLDDQGCFAPRDQVTLLHEYGHLKQPEINYMLQQYISKIPFRVDDMHIDEIAADVYAYMTLKPSALRKVFAEYGHLMHQYKAQDEYAEHQRNGLLGLRRRLGGILTHIREGMKLRELERRIGSGDIDGQHATFLQRHCLQEIALDIQAAKIRLYNLQGYNESEIEYSWPLPPKLRRIAR